MLDESKSSLLLFDIVSTTFIPGKIPSEKKVSKLRSIAELRAFYGLLQLLSLRGIFGTREVVLLTVETEVNGGSKSTNERGPFLVGSLVLSCRYKRFLFCLGCSRWPSTINICFLTVHYFKSLVMTLGSCLVPGAPEV